MVVTEIFQSIQGESTHAGRPCIFVRLTGCNLRCRWCDTAYAFYGGTRMTVEEVLSLGPGSVVELNKLAGEPVDVLVNEQLIARGEVVVVDENFGVRVTEIVSPRRRAHAIGGA